MRTTRVDRMSGLRSAVPFALGLLLATAALAGLARADETPPTIEASELAQRIEAGDAPLVLDVRTPEEYARGHIPGAVNIPYDQLSERLDELGVGRGDEVVVHCHSGRRAALAEAVLRKAGYTRVRDLKGHWQGWSAAGLPTEK